jgi:hypothetical protein
MVSGAGRRWPMVSGAGGGGSTTPGQEGGGPAVFRCRGGGSATSGAHAWLPCDRGVVPATISEHRRLVCDPTVAGDHRPRTTTAPMCAPADVPRSPAIGRGVSESRPADETPAFVPGCAPPLSCRVEVAVSCDRGDSAVVERCVEVVEVAVGRSRGDPAVAQRCLDPAQGTVGTAGAERAVVWHCLGSAKGSVRSGERERLLTGGPVGWHQSQLPAGHRGVRGLEAAVGAGLED